MGGKGGSSGGNSGVDNGGGNGSSGGSGLSKGGGNGGAGGGYMKAPGDDRSYISRAGFEANPQLYISGLHVIKIEEHLEMDNKGCSKETGVGAAGAGGGNSSGGGTNKGGNNDLIMKAPGGDGAYTSRTGFENDPKGYFSDLHAKEKMNLVVNSGAAGRDKSSSSGATRPYSLRTPALPELLIAKASFDLDAPSTSAFASAAAATLGSDNGLGGVLSAVTPADMGSIEVDAVMEAELKENGFSIEWWLW
ncbi:keratin, type I cytoskeletal 9-like [Coffea eugenioides]|uniref:keratin, type I cytoskeletal 9-like n=1 Tax=Coffea eugenioides TaxID=49369 RepID=UPI000F610C0A|nr:keratin, type I cytoskeletal 9-like [Coffea eugenioides]